MLFYESSSKSSQNEIRRYLQCQLFRTVGGDVGDGFLDKKKAIVSIQT